MTDAELLQLKNKQLATLTRAMREAATDIGRIGAWLHSRGLVHTYPELDAIAGRLLAARAGKVTPTDEALADVAVERRRQHSLWGEQVLPNGTGAENARSLGLLSELSAKAQCEVATADGTVTLLHVLVEEVCEAAECTDVDALRTELIQVGAVAVKWVEQIDARLAAEKASAA